MTTLLLIVSCPIYHGVSIVSSMWKKTIESYDRSARESQREFLVPLSHETQILPCFKRLALKFWDKPMFHNVTLRFPKEVKPNKVTLMNGKDEIAVSLPSPSLYYSKHSSLLACTIWTKMNCNNTLTSISRPYSYLARSYSSLRTTREIQVWQRPCLVFNTL